MTPDTSRSPRTRRSIAAATAAALTIGLTAALGATPAAASAMPAAARGTAGSMDAGSRVGSIGSAAGG